MEQTVIAISVRGTESVLRKIEASAKQIASESPFVPFVVDRGDLSDPIGRKSISVFLSFPGHLTKTDAMKQLRGILDHSGSAQAIDEVVLYPHGSPDGERVDLSLLRNQDGPA